MVKKTPKDKHLVLPIIGAGVVAFIIIAIILAIIPKYKNPPIDDLSPTPSIATDKDCAIAGCSGELCVGKDKADIAGICIWSDKFACVKYSTCEKQKNGQCGWTENEEYSACLNKIPQ